jgi:hypothetical protein
MDDLDAVRGERELDEGSARGLAERAAVFQGDGRNQEAATLCDELIERFGVRQEPSLRYYVAYALFMKGETMELLVRHTEAAAAYGALLAHFAPGESKEIDHLLHHASRRRSQVARSHHWGA